MSGENCLLSAWLSYLVDTDKAYDNHKSLSAPVLLQPGSVDSSKLSQGAAGVDYEPRTAEGEIGRCRFCPPGFEADAARSSCGKCAEGTAKPGRTGVCEPCPTSWFARTDRTACIHCAGVLGNFMYLRTVLLNFIVSAQESSHLCLKVCLSQSHSTPPAMVAVPPPLVSFSWCYSC